MVNDNTAKLREMMIEKHTKYKDTFSTINGEWVLRDLEKDTYVNRSTITDSTNVDPYQIAFREGMRSVILKIRNYMSDELIKLGEKNASSQIGQ